MFRPSPVGGVIQRFQNGRYQQRPRIRLVNRVAPISDLRQAVPQPGEYGAASFLAEHAA